MKEIRTSLTDRLGLRVPIAQAPMGGSCSAALIAAVANAGALGLLPATWLTPAQLREEMRQIRDLTDRPFGVNLVLAEDPAANLNIALSEGARLVSFFWGDPGPWIGRVHAAGGLVMQTVASAEEARRCVDAGVDILVAQGVEAGGHVWGEVGTLALVPAVVDAASGVPVIAAGGIADGRGLAAVLALGAAGAWIGTRFLMAEEATTHPLYRAKLIAAPETSTVHTSLFDGGWPDAPHRCLVNSTVRAWQAGGSPPPGRRPGEGEEVAKDGNGTPIHRYSASQPEIGMSGELEALVLYAGQGVGLCRRMQSAAAIIAEIMDEAVETIARLSR